MIRILTDTADVYRADHDNSAWYLDKHAAYYEAAQNAYDWKHGHADGDDLCPCRHCCSAGESRSDMVVYRLSRWLAWRDSVLAKTLPPITVQHAEYDKDPKRWMRMASARQHVVVMRGRKVSMVFGGRL